jgi:hypothetical protein
MCKAVLRHNLSLEFECPELKVARVATREVDMSQATTTTDHETIRQWVEQRGGYPATVKSTADDEPGVLRIDFPGYGGGNSLERISWESFFGKFESSDLAFLYQERTDEGEPSRFCKFVGRDGD